MTMCFTSSCTGVKQEKSQDLDAIGEHRSSASDPESKFDVSWYIP